MAEATYINHPVLPPFLTTVKEYCSFIERPDWKSSNAFIRSIQKNLVSLYHLGMQLPELNSEKTYADTLEIPEEVLNNALQNLKRNTPFQYYWTVLNPLELSNDPETGTGDLIDDLFDIYKELKLAITYYEEIDGYQDFGLWLFQFTFHSHWGEHCIEAIQVIHTYLNNKDQSS